LLDWKACGAEYAAEMVLSSSALAQALVSQGVPVYGSESGSTLSHAFAIDADRLQSDSSPDHNNAPSGLGAGQDLAIKLRQAMLLSSGIGLPTSPASGPMGGLRVGTNELVRWGMTASDMPALALLITRAIATRTQSESTELSNDVRALRSRFQHHHFLA
jgi:glycine hydroxymethyltransferase